MLENPLFSVLIRVILLALATPRAWYEILKHSEKEAPCVHDSLVLSPVAKDVRDDVSYAEFTHFIFLQLLLQGYVVVPFCGTAEAQIISIIFLINLLDGCQESRLLLRPLHLFMHTILHIGPDVFVFLLDHEQGVQDAFEIDKTSGQDSQS